MFVDSLNRLGIQVWIYRNSVYGYPWFKSVRTLLDDPAYAPWFMMYGNSTGPYISPNCDTNYKPPKCTQYFHTQMDTPLPHSGGYGECHPTEPNTGCDCGTKPCGFYVFNHSATAIINNQSFQEWFINSYMLNEIGGDELVDGFYWDDTWYPGGVGDDPEKGMLADMGLTSADLLQLTASYNANMLALRNRTLAAGKFAWQLLTSERVPADPSGCTAALQEFCQPGAAPQTEAMYFPIARPQAPAFTNCTVFGCTCKGEADYYGIREGSFGCAPVGAQQWWIHEAKPCNSSYSCCTVEDYTQKPPPYQGCEIVPKVGGKRLRSMHLISFLRCPHSFLVVGCAR